MYIVNEHVVDFYKNCQKARMSQTLDWRKHPLWRRFHVRWVMLHALWTRARCRANSYAQSKVLKLAALPFCCKITASSLGTCVTCACSPLIRYVHVSQTVEASVRPSVRPWGCLPFDYAHTCICRKRLKPPVRPSVGLLAFWLRTRAFVGNGWSAVCLPFDQAHAHLSQTVEAPCVHASKNPNRGFVVRVVFHTRFVCAGLS